MISKFLKRFTNNNNCSKDGTDISRYNNSVLLSVPLYFYLEFIKIYHKSFSICFLVICGIFLAYLYAPDYYYSSKTSTSLLASSKIDKEYIQNFNSYEDILKLLRKMQETANFLQIKQQASDRKAMALQQQITKLQMGTSDGSAGILNEEKARNMIREALTVYDADKLGLRDYALENLGGLVLSVSSTSPKLTQRSYTFFGIFNFHSYSNPRSIIQAEVQAGNCFAFYGSYARIKMRLANEIFISAVTMEHVSTSLLTPEEVSAAPKNFAIHGLFEESALVGYPLGQFSYSIEGPPRQTFIISTEKDTKSFQMIEFEILSNHGNEEYTCVYRLRVHGRLANQNND